MDEVRDETKAEFQRAELLTGPTRRRRWLADEKARIVAEILVPGARVSEVAGRWQLHPQQSFGWRREARVWEGAPGRGGAEPKPGFVPIVATGDVGVSMARPAPMRSSIEVALAGAAVRVTGKADDALLTAVPRGTALVVGCEVIGIPAVVRVVVATRPVDFRKGAHALAALASELLSEDPFSGVVIVFRAKRADRLKLLVWDTSGLVLVWKELQQSFFR